MPDYRWIGTIVEDDFGKYIQFTIYDEDDELYDYTGYDSIVCYFKKYGENTCRIVGVCSSVGTGTIHYQLVGNDTDNPGEYKGELKVYSPSAITTWSNLHLTVKEKVA